MAKLDDLYSAEQALYAHLLDLVKVEEPDRLLDRFQTLFVRGSGYPDPEIASIVQSITQLDEAEHEFNSVLNRCCHILINHWQMESKSQPAIPELVQLISNSGERRMQSRDARRMQGLLEQFKSSDEYLTLQRLVRVVDRNVDLEVPPKERPLSTLIGRYPYLYGHSLVSDGSSYEHQQTVKKLQAQRQRQYELHLSKYVTYKVRRAQLARQNPNLLKNPRIIKPVRNPTLLSDRDLYVAVKQFSGRAEGSYTYKDRAQNFRTHTSQTRTYREFKEDLFEYLIVTIDEDYGKRQFYDKLYAHLMNTLPQCDDQKPTEFSILRTCSQLLNFLVVESPQNPNHYVLIDLLSNIGPTFVMALLLKILLICRKVRPYLEKRFSILFDHYDRSTREAVRWLIESLENLQVALSTNFGSADISILSHAS